MKFFKKEDFSYEGSWDVGVDEAADIANAKLEREGRVVTGWKDEGKYCFHESRFEGDIRTHTAILINIKEINTCKHPNDKIHETFASFIRPLRHYVCECGSTVEPASFKPIDTP